VVANAFSTCAAVPLASTSIPLRSVVAIVKPWERSHDCTDFTSDAAGAYLASNCALVSHRP
jgi:hypothetical protein